MVARTIEITGKLDFVCPFCSGRVTLGEAAESGNYSGRSLHAGEPVALHSMPFCRQFDTMDLIAFVRACRIKGARPLS
jgi:hypothetical protein